MKKPLITCLIIGSLLWGICPAVLADEPTEATQENTVTEDIATDDSLTQDTPMNNTSNENVPNENALTANTETEESPQKHGINYYAGDHTTYYTDYSLMNDEFPNADIRFTTVGFELARETFSLAVSSPTMWTISLNQWNMEKPLIICSISMVEI